MSLDPIDDRILIADTPSPMPLFVVGRGKLVGFAVADGHGVTLRIDDDANPDFWCEIRLDSVVLMDLLVRTLRTAALVEEERRQAVLAKALPAAPGTDGDPFAYEGPGGPSLIG